MLALNPSLDVDERPFKGVYVPIFKATELTVQFSELDLYRHSLLNEAEAERRLDIRESGRSNGYVMSSILATKMDRGRLKEYRGGIAPFELRGKGKSNPMNHSNNHNKLEPALLKRKEFTLALS